MGRPRKTTELLEPGSQQYRKERAKLKAEVRSLYDFQHVRLQSAGRLTMDRNGEDYGDRTTPSVMDDDAIVELNLLWDDVRCVERRFERAVASTVSRFPEWELFLKDVKGIGPMMAAVLITEIDIEKAVNAAKITQFAGLNSSMVRGKKMVDGRIVQTDDLIRGDRPTKGYILPYNSFLKTKVLQVMVGGFIKAGNNKYAKIYYDTKNRYENSRAAIATNPEKTWADTSKKHRDLAARRKAAGIFLQDYYAAVRAIWNLPIRCPYQEEYLAVKHDDPKWGGGV